ncbi:MAG: class I SAM-dependent DNA methyltransferase [Treponema sp.]|nr:class I SAM-dependent DNA methyltransferase [Candidatus Treponema equifaecale]
MTQIEQQKAAKKFSRDWKDKGYEKGESQKFWLDLLCNVFGVQDFANFISFEDQVKLDHTSFIDGYISSTKVLIEQKSIDKDLRSPIKQSDGSFLNPFQQAKRYITELPLSKHPRWVVTSNFRSFLVYDMEQPNGEPEEILLENLEKEFYRLSFITDLGNVHLKKELEISKKAGDIIGEIYDAILAQYKDASNPSPATLKSLNMLCVRIVFCLYAEDAGIFGHKSIFGDYLKGFEAKDLRRALLDLFQVLDQKIEERDEYLEESLAQFPYVNGGLFTEEDRTIPPLTEDIKELLVKHASSEFDWSEISPTIFGAIFESTLNPETRRSGGMHYTSIENIHKVIDPLFLDDLRNEFEEIKQIKQVDKRIAKTKEFHKKLGTLKFLDPACGSGNFLTETYLSLRKLGNECIKVELNIGEGELNLSYKAEDLIQVSIQQFYGIEINDFAAVVAKTALWIAESQMLKETSKIIDQNLQFLPLHTYANIVEGNALRIDWNTVGESLPLASTSLAATPSSGDTPQRPAKYDYIMGNPPFVGARWMSKEQKTDVLDIFGSKWNGVGDLDYVCCWYKKAADLIQNTNIKCALVSTNSISQGGAVTNLWKPLFENFGIQINFAWRTFKWDSEANIKAHVHCVIIGFSCEMLKRVQHDGHSEQNNCHAEQNNYHSELVSESNKKRIYTSDKTFIEAKKINGYLLNAENIFIEKRQKPLSDVPEIALGGQAIDDGNLIMTVEEKNEILKKEPQAAEFFRPYMMGKDFIERKPRACLWLVGANPSLLKKCPLILERIEKVREFRLKSERSSTLKAANTPTLFASILECKNDYIAIPKVSSENRRYIPMDYLSKDIIPGDKLFTMQNASLFHFGVMMSNVHNAWMRAVCGRLKSDYSYSNTIVYNNFPWPEQLKIDNSKLKMENGRWTLSSEEMPADKRELSIVHSQLSIINSAQAILDARAKYPDCSLADLYDETVMPPDLRKAHQENDRAVMAAYGFSTKMTESECVGKLFELYEQLTGGK